MKKNTTLSILSKLLIILFLLLPIKFYQLNAKNDLYTIKNSILKSSITLWQDKSLIKGVWQRTDTPDEITISEVLDTGLLNATYSNSELIIIEKASWTNSAEILRVYILLRKNDYPGSSLSLNYIAEKDLLLGVYFDALTNQSSTVSFKRIK